MYPHKDIEKKWQEYWEKNNTFATDENSPKPKQYILDMFPYPSGDGLHVGHPLGYTATDIYSRYLRATGHEVLHPIGWDAFGLPAENYAIKKGTPPQETTDTNIKNFTRQIKSLGLSYDWSREINTSSPEYYRWTQWLFLQLYRKGLAHKKSAPVNWCETDHTVLANEQVVNGLCERCKNPVIQKELEQWFFKVTEYAEELLAALDELDWPEPIKAAQRNWIGKSEGAEISFQISDSTHAINVFTTRPDTLYGATYLVLAPEHHLVEMLAEQITNHSAVQAYRAAASAKNELERTQLEKDKTGIQLEGITALNPATGEALPVWLADYVITTYGTGAVMAVPAHDERDHAFAVKYSLPIKQVVAPVTGTPQANPEFRRSIVAIVRNPKTGEFLSLDWKELGGSLFIGGGLEDGEDAIVCAQREIAEETGYTNLSFVAQTGPIHHHYFAQSKNIARHIEAQALLFDLVEETKETAKLEQDEAGKFTVQWLNAKTVETQIKDELHALSYRLLVKGEIYTGAGILCNSGTFDGLTSTEARPQITTHVRGELKTTYRLRDWLISRQRYWGAPIPIIYCDEHGEIAAPEAELPVVLPTDVDFRPTGESPLVRSESFHAATCPTCGKSARRESDTMDTFVCSSWYFLRYADPKNTEMPFSKAAIDRWLPVDRYVGGAEHAVLHLLYARFVTKALRDMGFVSFSEPFKSLRNQGLIMGEDGEKMSKSRGNVVNPDEVISTYGADTLRVYEMFMGPFEDAKPWSTTDIIGSRRFLDRAWRICEKAQEQTPAKIESSQAILRELHKAIKKVTTDITDFHFNTAISTLMVLSNAMLDAQNKGVILAQDTLDTFLIILAPFAPHLAEELWSQLGHTESITLQPWPTHDEQYLIEDAYTLTVQVNGKLRDTFVVPAGITEDDALVLSLAREGVAKWVRGKTVKKVIFVSGRLLNLVVPE